MLPDFAKIASLMDELADDNDRLRAVNAALNARLEAASAQQARKEEEVQVKTASASTVDVTCAKLIAGGLITPDQMCQTKQAFLEDPDAAHRVIQAILDQQEQFKSAALSDSLRGGHVVDARAGKPGTDEDDERAYNRILSYLQ